MPRTPASLCALAGPLPRSGPGESDLLADNLDDFNVDVENGIGRRVGRIGGAPAQGGRDDQLSSFANPHPAYALVDAGGYLIPSEYKTSGWFLVRVLNRTVPLRP